MGALFHIFFLDKKRPIYIGFVQILDCMLAVMIGSARLSRAVVDLRSCFFARAFELLLCFFPLNCFFVFLIYLFLCSFLYVGYGLFIIVSLIFVMLHVHTIIVILIFSFVYFTSVESRLIFMHNVDGHYEDFHVCWIFESSLFFYL